MKKCSICGGEYDELAPVTSAFQEAGAWLAAEVWQDAGELCPRCLEKRAQLAMM